MKLLTSQKDALYDLIEKIGLSPSQFDFEQVNSQFIDNQIDQLAFKNSDFFFNFDFVNLNGQSHHSLFCPGQDQFIEKAYPGDWSNQVYFVSQWLKNLLREINTPDKWVRLSQELYSISLQFENEEDKFSVSEFRNLENKIILIKERLHAIGMLPEQLQIINKKLDDLTELAKEMNKFDWKSLFIGTIISVIIQLGVTQENAKSIWEAIKEIFSNYLLP